MKGEVLTVTSLLHSPFHYRHALPQEEGAFVGRSVG